MEAHTLFVEEVQLAKKGQITIPKAIRDQDNLRENDFFILTHLPGGDLVLRKKIQRNPEDLMLDAIAKAPAFNAKAAWKEVIEERQRERA